MKLLCIFVYFYSQEFDFPHIVVSGSLIWWAVVYIWHSTTAESVWRQTHNFKSSFCVSTVVWTVVFAFVQVCFVKSNMTSVNTPFKKPSEHQALEKVAT